jgi:porphobilinogen synthase
LLRTETKETSNFYFKEALKSVGLKKEQLIMPIFICDRSTNEQGFLIPGISKSSEEYIVKLIQGILQAGISSVIIFGVPKRRGLTGAKASDGSGLVQQAVRIIKKEFGDLLHIITDVCICQYNLSGQCGVVKHHENSIDNDATLRVLSKIALSHAEAGSDTVAPSSMMDGQVSTIRSALNQEGFAHVGILSYSAKYFSSLYTPFRSLAYSKNVTNLAVIDKSTYQLSYCNIREAIREIEADIYEGADMVMIKPSMYLDIIALIREKITSVPIVAQNVSGEYAMIRAASMRKWIDELEWKVNTFVSIKRAGADRIISYFSMEIARYLNS